MGSGYKVFTSGAVLTASDLNNFCQEQTVMYFANTTARDTAITSPEDGMVAYVGSNDANEGLYTYNGSGWRKGPGWNAPWGYVANGSLLANTAFTTGLNWGLAFTWSGTGLIANRRYLLQTSVILEPGALGQANIEIGTGVGTGMESRASYYANGTSWITTVSTAAVFTTTAGTMTRYVSMRMSSGTGQVKALEGSTYQVIDIGPAGAPA
jgi:hypothetical protein